MFLPCFFLYIETNNNCQENMLFWQVRKLLLYYTNSMKSTEM